MQENCAYCIPMKGELDSSHIHRTCSCLVLLIEFEFYYSAKSIPLDVKQTEGS